MGELPSHVKCSRTRSCWNLSWWFVPNLLLLIMLEGTRTFVSASITSPPKTLSVSDFRVVTYEDLVADVAFIQYYHRGLEDFSKFVFDTQRMQVIVGARNHLLRLSMIDLSEFEVERWAPDNRSRALCVAKGKPEEECHNFIRVLHIQGGELYTCGTYAYRPKCSWRSITQLQRLKGSIEPGIAKCPYSPKQNTTSIMTSDGSFFSGIVMDFNARDYAIYRIMGRLDPIRTPQYTSQWINSPQFVSSYEIDDMVYFFFREVANEYINCGKTIYSRVARLCKNDPGGRFSLLEDNWTTFMKARLNCSISGDFPFYFNELQSTYLMEEEGLLYGVFTTPTNSIHGSAVCVFNMTAIKTVFDGPVKFQATSRMAWERRSNPFTGHQCPSSPAAARQAPAREDLPALQQFLSDAAKYKMIDSAVQPNFTEPLASAQNERWSHVVVDSVRTKNKTYHVVFVSTLDGVIKKYSRLPSGEQACLIEVLRLFPVGYEQPVKNMKILEGYLYVGTKEKLMKLPVHRCSRFKTRTSCLYAMDPYCGWHNRRGKCEQVGRHTIQTMDSCPVTEYMQHGGWSEWDSWQTCEHTDSFGDVNQCKCRTRRCDNPAPMKGGNPCPGSAMGVVNCTVHGKWSLWSSWSSCSMSCGRNARRSRSRQCSSPSPQFGGRGCSGATVSNELCTDNPDCPLPAVNGRWSGWSEWTQCSKLCGEGVRQRRRSCNDPSPSNGGQGCVGNEREWNVCNSFTCPEKRRSSQWTPWMRANGSRADGYTEVRYKFMCKANVPDDRLINTGSMKMEKRACSRGGSDCSSNGDGTGHVRNINGGWSYWSEWTPCDQQCGGGKQWRERRCDNPEPLGNGNDCMGYHSEQKECNIHSCEGEWSCWGEFSSCSVSCGNGVKWRRRSCQSSVKGRVFNLPCAGSNRETAVCNLSGCESTSGWKEWSLWSLCSTDSMQVRKRQCTVPSPTNSDCVGMSQEERPCLFNEGEIRLGRVQEEQDSGGGLRIEHAVGGAIGGFVAGALVVFGIFMYIRRKEKNDKPQLDNEKNHKNEAKPNLYMTTLPSVQSGINLNNHYCSEQSLNAMNTTLNTSTLNRQVNRKESKKVNIKENSKRNSMRTNLSLNEM